LDEVGKELRDEREKSSSLAAEASSLREQLNQEVSCLRRRLDATSEELQGSLHYSARLSAEVADLSRQLTAARNERAKLEHGAVQATALSARVEEMRQELARTRKNSEILVGLHGSGGFKSAVLALARMFHRLTPEQQLDRRLRVVRQSGVFDPDWYLQTYPDVSAAGLDPLEHYCQHGIFEGRRPNPNASSYDILIRQVWTA
jgi:hypothetical protein